MLTTFRVLPSYRLLFCKPHGSRTYNLSYSGVSLKSARFSFCRQTYSFSSLCPTSYRIFWQDFLSFLALCFSDFLVSLQTFLQSRRGSHASPESFLIFGGRLCRLFHRMQRLGHKRAAPHLRYLETIKMHAVAMKQETAV